MVTSPVAPSQPDHRVSELEWHQALETGRHFNDLLIRLRGLALPLLVAAAGLAASQDFAVVWSDVNVQAMAVACIAAGLLVVAILWRARSEKPSEALATEPPSLKLDAEPHPVEWVTCGSFALLLLVDGAILFTRSWNGTATMTVPVVIPLLALAVLLVTAVYALDRYYYFRLLVGAASRAHELEQAMDMKLTASITQSAPVTPARLLISALYLIPIAVGLGALTLFFAFA